MNKNLLLQIGLVMAIMLGVFGCTLPEETEQTQIVPSPAGYGWEKRTYANHVYVLCMVYGGFSIVHDPDCPCHKKLEQE
jgi:hypothetical protein